MKESYSEALARHAGPESYADRGNTLGVATARVHAGPVLSSEIFSSRVPTSFRWRKATLPGALQWRAPCGRDGVEDLVHVWKLQAREPGDPICLLEEVASSGPRTPLEVMRT